MRRSLPGVVTCVAGLLTLHCSSPNESAFVPSPGLHKDAATDKASGKDSATEGASDGNVLSDGTLEGAVPDQVSEPPTTCTPGLLQCKNNVKFECDASGQWVEKEDCGANVCSVLYGCVLCIPGSGLCNGSTVHRCRNDGSGYDDYECDALLGSTCEEGECTGPCAPENLGKSYIGCEYYPTVTLNTQIAELGGFDSFHYAVAVSNTSTTPATVTITQGSNTVATETVAASSVKVILLPWTSLRTAKDATTLLASGAYRLRSTQPITVYQFNPLEYCVGSYCSYSNDASLLLPVNAWGTSYLVASRNTWQKGSFNLPGFYTVVASKDETAVTLEPSATGKVVRAGAGVPANGAATVTINQGDALQVVSGAPTTADLTGTLVSADKPVQVIGGHACTYIPAGTPACDHLEESMFPVKTLSTEYIVSPPSLPTLTTPKPFFVRAIAAEADTTLEYDPPKAGLPGSLAQAGDYVEIDAAANFSIKSNKRILVSQYMKSQQAGGNSGDPAMALAVTTGQFRKDYLFHSPVNYETNYVNITAPTGAEVTLDGQAVTSQFEPVGATGFGVARVKFVNAGDGNHRVSCSVPIGVTVYGYGQYTSYWYAGGLNLTDL